jgi:hypothetical protein
VVHIDRMTGQAERTGWREPGDRGRLMTLVAPGMGGSWGLVRRGNVGRLMAAGAITICRMMVVVAADTSCDSWLRLEAHRRGVTLHAPELRMFAMLEADRAPPGWMFSHCHLHRDLVGGLQLWPLMTCGAVASGRTLVMADLAATRRLEGQIAPSGTGAVTSDAGESAMAVMGEAVGR